MEVVFQVNQTREKDLPRVLIVDDEPRILRSLEAALRSRYSVSKAEDAIQAREMMQQPKLFDVIVSDERMPGCPGHVFLKWAKDNHPQCTRIMLSSSEFNTRPESIASAEVYKCLTKPWDILELQNTLDQAVLRSRFLMSQSAKNQSARSCIMAVLDQDRSYRESYDNLGKNLDGILGMFLPESADELIWAMSQGAGIGVLFVDLSIGNDNAVDLIDEITKKHSSTSIIVTAEPGPLRNFVLESKQGGVFQHVSKPMSLKRIQPIVSNACHRYLHQLQ